LRIGIGEATYYSWKSKYAEINLKMRNQKKDQWIAAAKILRADPTEKVECPNCGYQYLQVKDVIVEKFKKCDRYMFCDSCKGVNVMTFSTE